MLRFKHSCFFYNFACCNYSSSFPFVMNQKDWNIYLHKKFTLPIENSQKEKEKLNQHNVFSYYLYQNKIKHVIVKPLLKPQENNYDYKNENHYDTDKYNKNIDKLQLKLIFNKLLLYFTFLPCIFTLHFYSPTLSPIFFSYFLFKLNDVRQIQNDVRHIEDFHNDSEKEEWVFFVR